MNRLSRILVLGFVVLAAPAAALAATWEKGIALGANYASLRGEDADALGLKAKTGFVGGPFVALELSPLFAVQTEARFSMKGMKTTLLLVDDMGLSRGSYDLFWDLKYLEVPLLLRASFPPSARVQPMLYAGPSLGILLRGTWRADAEVIGSGKMSNLRPLDLGVALGGGVRVGSGPRRLVADLRYNPSFSTMFQDAWETRNDVVSLTLGYGF